MRRVLVVGVVLFVAGCRGVPGPEEALKQFLQACTVSDTNAASRYWFSNYLPVVYTYKILRDDNGAVEHGETQDVRAVVQDYSDTTMRPERMSEAWQKERRQFIESHPVFSEVLFTVAGHKVFPPEAFEKPSTYSVETRRFVVDLEQQNISTRARETRRLVYVLARVSVGDNHMLPEEARGWFIGHIMDVGER